MPTRESKKVQVRLAPHIYEQVEMLSDLYGVTTNSLLSIFIGQATVTQVKMLDGFQDKVIGKMVDKVEQMTLDEVDNQEIPEFLRTGKLPLNFPNQRFRGNC